MKKWKDTVAHADIARRILVLAVIQAREFLRKNFIIHDREDTRALDTQLGVAQMVGETRQYTCSTCGCELLCRCTTDHEDDVGCRARCGRCECGIEYYGDEEWGRRLRVESDVAIRMTRQSEDRFGEGVDVS